MAAEYWSTDDLFGLCRQMLAHAGIERKAFEDCVAAACNELLKLRSERAEMLGAIKAGYAVLQHYVPGQHTNVSPSTQDRIAAVENLRAAWLKAEATSEPSPAQADSSTGTGT